MQYEMILLLDTPLVPYWKQPDFWINLVLTVVGVGVSVFGLIYSVKAFSEAKKAKDAANQAGKTVKIQSITIDINELIQKLDKLDTEISFSGARDFLAETTRRTRRLISPFQTDHTYSDAIKKIYSTLETAKTALNQAKPIENTKPEVQNAVYYAIEEHLAELSANLADLMGLFEQRTIEIQ